MRHCQRMDRGKGEKEMKALFIGGTGTISTAVVKRLVNELGWEVWLLNRGRRNSAALEKARQITADIHDEAAVAKKIADLSFDVVCEFIGFRVEDVERDQADIGGQEL